MRNLLSFSIRSPISSRQDRVPEPQIINQRFDRFDLRAGAHGIDGPIAMRMGGHAIEADLPNALAPIPPNTAMVPNQSRE